jgi:Na+/melibiose symporter-like transporter
VVQACFSIGGTIAPFFATPFVERMGDRPYLYFYISMGVAIFAFGIMGLAFVRGGIEEIVQGPKAMVTGYDGIEGGESIRLVTPTKKEEGDHSWGKIKRLLTNPLILALMMWSFFYVSHLSHNKGRADKQAGAESSVSGYLVIHYLWNR